MQVTYGKIPIEIPNDGLIRFCRQHQVQRLALFGSVLRDDFHPDSDVDILVKFSPSARVSFMSLGQMKRELTSIFHRPVDLVPEEGLKPAIREEILSSAREVYAA